VKIIALMGNLRNNSNSEKLTKIFEDKLKASKDLEIEYIFLKDSNIKGCIGCQACYIKGEGYCPERNDDIEDIRERLKNCDGFIMVSPTYVMNVTHLMKNFIDRLSFICHRPEFFGKKVFLLSTTGRMGSSTTLKLMRYAVTAWGCKVIGELGINMCEFNNSTGYREDIERAVEKGAAKFYNSLLDRELPKPGISDIIGFKMKRKKHLDDTNGGFDRQYWQNNGWLEKEADYYYKTKVGILKSIIADIFIAVMVPFLNI
jgi:multimeric flavodoxin WrbA